MATSAVQRGAPAIGPAPRGGRWLVVAAGVVAALLPIIGFASLLLREQLDPDFSNPQLHFTLFLAVGAGLLIIAYDAGESAHRRGDARVLLISLAFLSTGAFLMLHAFGTADVLFKTERAGFKVAIPIGLLLSAGFALASAFADARPWLPAAVVRRRALLWRLVLGAAAVWLAWTWLELPPLDRPTNEGGTKDALAVLAAVATVAYAVASLRYLVVYRGKLGLLPASVAACFALLAEAMIGVAITGERAWHASWWEWHGLIVLAYVVVAYAVIGDTVNTASRLEGQAPVGGVLIGERTRELLPDGTRAEPVTDVRVKGKEATLDAFLLQALP